MFNNFISLWNKFPPQIREPAGRICRRQYFGICCLALITLILHFSTINQPDSFVFDEVHYVPEARAVIAGEGAVYFQHPPLARLLIIAGVNLFGDNPFGWRFFSIIFATISVVLFYFICRKLEMPKGGPFLATLVFMLENLSFVLGGIAMLDVFMVTFMLGAFLLYLHYKPVASGLSLALSSLAKTTGVFTAVTLFIDWLLDRQRKWLALLGLAGTAIISYGVLFFVFNTILNGTVENPLILFRNMLEHNAGLTFANYEHSALSYPWDWLLQPTLFWGSLEPQYIFMISPTVWAVIFPVVAYLIYECVKGGKAGRFGVAWFAGTYLPVVLLVIVLNRITFLTYFYPVIGAVCLGIGLGLAKLVAYWQGHKSSKKEKIAIIGILVYLYLHVIGFFVMSPV